MAELIKFQIIGRLGADADTRTFASGASLSRLKIASDSYRRSEGKTEKLTIWNEVSLWGNEKVLPYLLKGTLVFIEGTPEHKSWEKSGQTYYKTELSAREVMLLSRPDSGSKSASRSQPAPAQREPGDDELDGQGITDDDIPF